MSMSVPGAFVPARSLELSKTFPWNMCETSNPLLWQRVFDFPFFVIHKSYTKSLSGFELPPIVRTAQKSLYVGKYEVLSGVAQRERRHSSF